MIFAEYESFVKKAIFTFATNPRLFFYKVVQKIFSSTRQQLILDEQKKRIDFIGPHVKDFKKDFMKTQEFTDVSIDKMFMLWEFLNHTKTLVGDVAECGVNRGGTAYLLSQTMMRNNSKKKIYLLDSFEGMPETDPTYDGYFKRGDYNNTSLEIVQNNLKASYKNIEYIKGFVEDTLYSIDQLQFSFVHIDVDLLSATSHCIQFFYPRMVPGGCMIDDDYGAASCPGAKKAIDDFMEDKPEQLILLPTSQALIIKF